MESVFLKILPANRILENNTSTRKKELKKSLKFQKDFFLVKGEILIIRLVFLKILPGQNFSFTFDVKTNKSRGYF
jgi:hypothetical protein